jgi:hypothetical protein
MNRMNRRLFAGAVIAGLAMAWAASPAWALPPDPDNAALLYYQAFLMMAGLDKETRDNIGEVGLGRVAPNEKTRECVNKCRAAIELADVAKGLPVCDWGFRYSQGFETLIRYQFTQMRWLAFVLLADARVRVLDGDYKGAIKRCLQMRTFSRHIGNDTIIAYLVGTAVQQSGYDRINKIIASPAVDAELLHWLQSELAVSDGGSLSPIPPLKAEMEISLNMMRMDKRDKLRAVWYDPEYKDMDKALRAEGFLLSADETAMQRARQLYSQHVTSVLAILSAGKSYEQTHEELSALVSSVDANDQASVVVGFISPALDLALSAKTRVEACLNATKAGVAICLQRAQTGKLPQALLADLPKDPFSGKDFLYERTGAGFTLRCRGKDLAKDKVYEFTFTVK